MRSITLVAMLIAIIGMTNASRMEKPCFFFLEGGNGFYNLERIYKKDNTEVKVPGINGNVQFNLCHGFTPENCDGKTNAIGYIIDGNNCTPLTTDNSSSATKWTYEAIEPVPQQNNRKLEQIHKPNNIFLGMAQHRKYHVPLKAGVEIETFPNFEEKDFGKKKGVQITANNQDTGLDYDVTFRLNCDLNAKSVQGLEASLTGRQMTITLNSDDACSFDVMSFWDRLGPFKWVAEVGIAVIALAMCLFGIKIYKPSIGIIGFFAGAGASYIFASMFLDISQKENWYLWVEIGICVALGIVCCIL